MTWGVWDHGGWDQGIFLFFTLRGILICCSAILLASCLALIHGITRR